MNAQDKKVYLDGENSKKERKIGSGKPSAGSLGTRKAQQQQSRFKSLREDELQGPASRTRASLKKRQYESSSITHPLPDKQTLELIINTLQRKDEYEIFAEAVNPEEVEDYYEIIEEPMDFGTLRAKLHEGLYTSLEQFEHDVFLISGNAMHFNSSGTIFFRQARVIHKLAKKVFHVLRTNPENFESEFSENKQRSYQKSQDETDESNCKSFLKAFENTGGSGDGKKSDPIEEDRRSTYKPHLDLNNDSCSKSLIYLNQQGYSYTQSLMRFVKDLGPTAQAVAKRKLQSLTGDHQTTIHDLGKQPQIQSDKMRFNSFHTVSTDEISQITKASYLTNNHPINRGLDLRSSNGIGHRMDLNCSGERMNPGLAFNSMSLPVPTRQWPCESRSKLNLGKQPQVQSNQMWFNSSHTVSTDEISQITKASYLTNNNPSNRGFDLRSWNGIGGDESSGHRMDLNCSGERMNPGLAFNSMSFPVPTRQWPCESRSKLNLGKQPQVQSNQMWFNSSHTVSTDELSQITKASYLTNNNPSNRGFDLRSWNGIGGDESSGHRMDLNCSGERMNPGLAFNSMSFPVPTRQWPCESRSKLNLGKQPQVQSNQMWFNSSHTVSTDEISQIAKASYLANNNPSNRGLDLRSWNGIGGDESSGHRMGLNCSGGRMNPGLALNSMSLPVLTRQWPCESRSELNLGFLKSKSGKMNEERGSEENGCSSEKLFDGKDLTLHL